MFLYKVKDIDSPHKYYRKLFYLALIELIALFNLRLQILIINLVMAIFILSNFYLEYASSNDEIIPSY